MTEKFIDHMRAHGVGPHDVSEIIADNVRRRYRLEGDAAKTRNGTYQLREEPDGFAVGWCRSFREGVTHSWHSKSTRKASDEDREAWRIKANAAKAARELEQLEAAKAAAAKAEGIWSRSSLDPVAGYLERKGLQQLHGARTSRGMVVVPMRIAGKITGLQFIGPNGEKRFLSGSVKDGAYHAMATNGEPLDRIVIAEGYATAAKLREALTLPVIVAFDAGNLKPVARAIRKNNPDAEIIFAADNDQWTVKPNGEAWNAGIEHAQQAAIAIGGARVIAPQVPSDDPDRRTDWDDIARTEGPQAVRDAFAPAATEQDEPPAYDPPTFEPDAFGEPDAPSDPLSDIRPLGHNRGTYYFFPIGAGQIVALSAPSMGRIQNLYLLASRHFWERHYSPDGKTADSAICALASANLMDACHRRGIFQPESTRGVGAWIDGKTALVNCGDLIITSDGRRCHPAEFKGAHVYESGPRVVDVEADELTNREANQLREICGSLTWRKPQYGDLLAGWLVIAPIGAALRWRPHIWIAGRAGSGKSTIVNEIIEPVIGRIGIKRDGGTTEAGVRKALGASGRPYILDEAEAEEQARQAELVKILTLVRGASSGSVVENANAAYQVRSCFCLAAIIPRIEQVADKERISILEVLRDAREDRAERYAALIDAIHTTITPEFSERLLARTIANLDTLISNVDAFSRAASEVFGNKRSGDQIGPMLAGAYSLTTTRAITLQAAREWIARQNWDWHTATYDDSDAAKLVTYVMTKRVRYDHEGMAREATIGDLVQHAASPSSAQNKAADRALRPYGMRVIGDELVIANAAPQLKQLLKDTPYSPWQRTLSDYSGAHNLSNRPVYFAAGLTSKATALPLAAVIGSDAPQQPEPIDEEFQL